MDCKSEATLLKDEGNVLFLKGDYQAAVDVYTRAIAADGTSAVLYTNRAACYNYLRQFQQGRDSALKATELDQKYYKAWWRLAESYDALKEFREAARGWAIATVNLPKENLSAAQQAHKELFTSSLKRSRDTADSENVERLRQETGGTQGLVVSWPPGKAPWERAPVVVSGLTAQQVLTSSAVPLLIAVKELERGLKDMKDKIFLQHPYLVGVKVSFATNKWGFPVRTGGALVCLSDSLLADERAFHIDNMNYTDMTSRIIKLETEHSGAPDPGQKIENMINIFLRLHEVDGWNRVRPVICTTVRSLLLRGFVAMGLRRDVDIAYRFFDKAFKIVEWGRRVWHGVSTADRGQVFSDTFYAGVACQTLKAYKGAYIATRGRSSRFKLDEILKRADVLIAHTRSIDKKELYRTRPPGLVTAFVTYPEALAHSSKAWVLSEHLRTSLCKDVDEQAVYMRRAIESYFAAASLYPEDEEQPASCLVKALALLFKAGRPLRETLPIMERIRMITPGIMNIWEYSPFMREELQSTLQGLATFEAEVRSKMRLKSPGYGPHDAVALQSMMN
ncbi:hypothetical protein BV25DRAFT_1383334 [Artomyces pyxidatus]|uniref:Uncharacterized protein n=1 Tax=Artomyces pyxidatus TaxID=48021 RepID=A0ACB8TCA5_9AGAM|nr:hypothetical protein BV25DRAFT_1383334 [Artomyces pyxidatus]